jgi:hypothetical protein
MIELASRVPVQLSPRQAFVVGVVAAGVLLALLAAVLVESVLGGLIALVLRLSGHQPPRKSAFQAALDEMEEQIRER